MEPWKSMSAIRRPEARLTRIRLTRIKTGTSNTREVTEEKAEKSASIASKAAEM